MGVFARGNKLWIRYQDASGKWKSSATGYGLAEKKKAERLFREVTERIRAGQEVDDLGGPVTVSKWVEKWEASRTHADAGNERQRVRDHVLPVIGPMPIDEVRPRHIAEIVNRLRKARKAPKTIRNVYTAVRAMFRTAKLHDLIESDPCILKRQELGEIEDKVSGWRATAVYNRRELELLISSDAIPWDRQVLYALEGIGGLRHGEAAGLRWEHYDAALRPLGRLTIATSYDHERTKTSRTRLVPVHPTLAAILAEWKLRGWAEMMGRQPTPEDLIIPASATKRTKLGAMRSKNYSHKLLTKDLVSLGLRHRRGHDLRRTMISLARSDGARKDLLELCTHTPRRDAAIDMYTTIEWPIFCAEIAKMQIERRPQAEVIDLPKAVGADAESVTVLVTDARSEAKNTAKERWRRRESNPVEGSSAHDGLDRSDTDRSVDPGGCARQGGEGRSVDVGRSTSECNGCNGDRATARERGRFRAGKSLRDGVTRALEADEKGTLQAIEEAAESLGLTRGRR